MLEARQRRARPIDLFSAGDPSAQPEVLGTGARLRPMFNEHAVADDPEEAVVVRESVRLALVAALLHLPPKQRAVLILREVLRWRASEVAELLETSPASVNSALQRARATLQTRETSASGLSPTNGSASAQLLTRYVDAFEHYDMEALVSVLREDARANHGALRRARSAKGERSRHEEARTANGTRSASLVGAGTPRRGVLHGHPRRGDRDRGAAFHRGGARLLRAGFAVGGERLRADLRRPASARRASGGPARTSAVFMVGTACSRWRRSCAGSPGRTRR